MTGGENTGGRVGAPMGLSIRPGGTGGAAAHSSGPVRCAVVCAWNSKAVLDTHLAPSLARQSEPCEVRLLDTTVSPFPSAAGALNAAARGATAEWLIFAHQDVDLLSPNFLRDFIDAAGRLDRPGVIGVVGVATSDDHHIRPVNSIQQGPAGNTWTWGTPVSDATEVEAVDELLFGVRREAFEAVRFDEAACPRWDLYAVDLCLSLRARGLRSYVVPVTLRHLSSGKVRGSYFRTLAGVLRKHRGRFDRVYTTCGNWSSRQPVWWQQVRMRRRTAMVYIRRALGMSDHPGK